jgi:hypothetical protein
MMTQRSVASERKFAAGRADRPEIWRRALRWAWQLLRFPGRVGVGQQVSQVPLQREKREESNVGAPVETHGRIELPVVRG